MAPSPSLPRKPFAHQAPRVSLFPPPGPPLFPPPGPVYPPRSCPAVQELGEDQCQPTAKELAFKQDWLCGCMVLADTPRVTHCSHGTGPSPHGLSPPPPGQRRETATEQEWKEPLAASQSGELSPNRKEQSRPTWCPPSFQSQGCQGVVTRNTDGVFGVIPGPAALAQDPSRQ